MKLTFLGTGAAQNHVTPEENIKAGARRGSTLLIDGHILIDVSFQSFDFSEKLGLDTSAVTDIFITHTHDDHYAPSSLLKYAAATKQKINLWCHRNAVKHLLLSEEEAQKIEIHPLEVKQTIETNGVKVTAYAANHHVPDDEQALHYVVEKDGKKLFYGCDGGWFRVETWSALRSQKFDGVVLECTVGDHPSDFRIGGHNTMPMVRILAAAFREDSMTENGVIMASHLGNQLHDYLPHEETAKKMAEFGVIAAFDGMNIEI